nr:unnamed protein product [Callosobruchus analis]
MVHSRWLTIANRILKLYVFSLEPAENLLILLSDETETVRILTLCRVLKFRQVKAVSKYIRAFQLPKFNFEDENYIDLIDWSEVSEPPLAKFLEHTDILRYIVNLNLLDDLVLPRVSKFPRQTQATERCVKIVTESIAAVCGPERREGFSKTRLHSHKFMPTFNTRKKYRPL